MITLTIHLATDHRFDTQFIRQTIKSLNDIILEINEYKNHVLMSIHSDSVGIANYLATFNYFYYAFTNYNKKFRNVNNEIIDCCTYL